MVFVNRVLAIGLENRSPETKLLILDAVVILGVFC